MNRQKNSLANRQKNYLTMNDFEYTDIKVGDSFEFKRLITTEDIDTFADITGDFNPLHCDNEYAKSTDFKGRIAHGMLAGSLFSTIVGMLCPGKKALYLSQSLNFRKPILPNTEIIIRGLVSEKVDSVQLIIMKTEIIYNNIVAIDGEAKIKVRGA